MTAFDTVAHSYDESFSHTTLGTWLRKRVWATLENAFEPGDTVLELGCGTGEDTRWMANRDIRVHATDVSSEMLDVARQKVEHAALSERAKFSLLDASKITGNAPPPLAGADPFAPPERYDGVLANFGVLNCMNNWRELAAGLTAVVKPGGSAILVVMGPYCPWDWIWFSLTGQPRQALRRTRQGQKVSLENGLQIPAWYPSPRRLTAAFRPHFARDNLEGLGVLLPPSYGASIVERRPGLFNVLRKLDRVVGRTFPGTRLNDHYILSLSHSMGHVPTSLPADKQPTS